jgi:hypothetical protein
MPQVASNADDYAATRVNIFFPGVNPTLDGQCVSLVKWFMAEMSDVPNPQAARGDARYVGKQLVAEGLAFEVPYDQRRRGDIVCLEYGTYGHIYVQLSNGRVFEENVNWSGVDSKIVDGARVYASRIGSDSESWRHDAHVYRLKSYNEQGDNMSEIDALHKEIDDLHNQYNVDTTNLRKNAEAVTAIVKQREATIVDLQKQLASAGDAPNKLAQIKEIVNKEN